MVAQTQRHLSLFIEFVLRVVSESIPQHMFQMYSYNVLQITIQLYNIQWCTMFHMYIECKFLYRSNLSFKITQSIYSEWNIVVLSLTCICSIFAENCYQSIQKTKTIKYTIYSLMLVCSMQYAVCKFIHLLRFYM